MRRTKQAVRVKNKSGRLRIGNDWNAITIIALSQTNPLKAIAEFVENSLDAQAKEITIIRGKKAGQHYLKIIDDGEGLPRTLEGIPDFKYVATHICDSIKRRLKERGVENIQGEFGIGLLSFWTVGHRLFIISSAANGKVYQMEMEKGIPGYIILKRPHLMPIRGTQLTITPLLAGVRSLNGEKIQSYLASELRNRIQRSGVRIKIVDRISRGEFNVQPRQYSGQLIHNLSSVATAWGDVYAELYLNQHNPQNYISLFRCGTRVLPDITALDAFAQEPWTSGYFQGMFDVPFLHLNPGTRGGIIHDERLLKFCEALRPLAKQLKEIIQEQVKAEEERMSRNILRSVQRAFKEALLALPPEDYDWFNISEQIQRPQPLNSSEKGQPSADNLARGAEIIEEKNSLQPRQKKFFEFAGPLFSVRIKPGSTLVTVSETKSLRAVGLDKSGRQIEDNLSFFWEIIEGAGKLDKEEGEIVVFNAPSEPDLNRLKVTARQAEVVCEAESVITVVDSLLKPGVENASISKKGLPGYTLESAPGKLWRSRYDEARNLIIINKSHKDFVYATKQKTRKLRYVFRLFAKELICHNFLGLSPEQLLERMIELCLYGEDNLK